MSKKITELKKKVVAAMKKVIEKLPPATTETPKSRVLSNRMYRLGMPQVRQYEATLPTPPPRQLQ